MNFDWTINVSHVISFAGFVIGGLAVVFSLRTEIRIMVMRLDQMSASILTLQESMKKLVEVMVTVAKQESRMDAFDRRVDDLLRQREFRPPPS